MAGAEKSWGRRALSRARADAAAAAGSCALGAVLAFVMRPPVRRPAPPPVAVTAAVVTPEPAPPAPPSPDIAPSAAPGAGTQASAAPAEQEDAGAAKPAIWRVSVLSKDANLTYVEGVVGKRPLAVALGAAGMAKPEVQRVLHAFAGVKNLNHASPKDTFAFAKDKPQGHVLAFEYAISPEEVWQARDLGGELQASKLEIPVEQRRAAVAVALGEDIRASVTGAGFDDDITAFIDDAFDGRPERSELKPGARLRLIATEERIDSEFSRYLSLDAVELTPEGSNEPGLRIYYFRHASAEGSSRGTKAKASGGYYDAKGQQPYHGGWRTPVPMARIASRFNPQRMHPVLHVVMPHNGVDFAAPTGTPVYASAGGVVKSAGDGGPCGNMIQIDHPGGLTTAYCHLSRFASGLHAGQRVETRQLVGYVGQTGRATGPHLHFAVKRGEAFMDPLALKLDGMRVVPIAYRDEFAKIRGEMDAALDAIAMPAPLPGKPGEKTDPGKADEVVFDDSPGL